MRRLFLLFSMLLSLALTAAAQTDLRYGDNLTGSYGSAGDVLTPYVKFPAAMVAPFKGCQITKVRIAVGASATNVYLYIKNDPKDAKYIYRQKVETLSAGWNDITLDEPFTIGDDAIAIGYKASFGEGGGVRYTDDRSTDGDFLYYNSQNKWTTTGGGQAIRAVIEGDAMPDHLLLMSTIPSVKAPYGAESITLQGSVRNMGQTDIGGYTLAYSIDGGEETLVDIAHSVASGSRDAFELSIPVTAYGEFAVTVRAARADGHDVSYAGYDQTRTSFTARDETFMRRFVCEEFTGLWCGWCPRGMVGLELMKERYPGRFYAVSVHASGGDKLQIPEEAPYSYNEFWQNEAGAPSCKINRRLHGDPYNDIQNLCTMEGDAENHIAYTMTASWNADHTQITTHSTFFSDTDLSAPQLRAAFTVTEDGITGYSQTNYFAGGGSGAFYGWEDKASVTSDVVFNDVARGIFSSYQGDQCVDGDMTAGEKYHYDFTFDVPPTVSNKDNIHVIGQIINPLTGNILNAFSVVPTDPSTDAISTVQSPAVPEIVRQGDRISVSLPGQQFHCDVYTLNGILLSRGSATDSMSLPVSAAVKAVIVKVLTSGGNSVAYKL